MIFDPATRAVVDSTPLDTTPSTDRSLAIDPAAQAIYVTSKEQSTVSVIDADTRTLTTTVHLDSEPQHIAVDPLTHSVFVTTEKGGVSVLSSTATGSLTPPPAATPGPEVPVTAADGSFTVSLPNTLGVEPADPNGHDRDSLIFAMSQDSMFTASVTPADLRGSTCQESLDKTSPGVASKFRATIDPGGPTVTAVDGETAYRQGLARNGDDGSRFALLCVRHHDVEYEVFCSVEFHSAPADNFVADLDAIIASWKWSA